MAEAALTSTSFIALPLALTSLTRVAASIGNARLQPFESFEKTDRDLVFEILASLRLGSVCCPALKDLGENVGEPRAAHSRKIEPREIDTGPGSAGARSNIVGVAPVGVIHFALLRVAQNLVGLRDLLEPFLGLLVSRIDIRMKLPGELPVRLLDLFRRSFPFDS